MVVPLASAFALSSDEGVSWGIVPLHRLGCPVQSQSATPGRMGAGLSPSDTTGATRGAYTYVASLL